MEVEILTVLILIGVISVIGVIVLGIIADDVRAIKKLLQNNID